jgi:predicted nucleotidyltransferase
MIKILTLDEIRDILDSISSKLEGKVREAYVFGSVVEGTAVAGESDLDILIVPKAGYMDSSDYFKFLETEIERLLDLGVVMQIRVASNVTYARMIEEVRANGLKIA